MFEGVSSPEQLSLLCHACWSQCWEGASSLRVGGKGFFEVHSCRTERLEARSLLLPEPVLSRNEGLCCWVFKSISKGQAVVTGETLIVSQG